MPSKQERVIREKRTIEATRKNLMGPSGKLGFIARFLGSPIIRQGSGLFDQSFLEDPYSHPMETIPESEDVETYEQGYVFDGLSRGMHIEVKYAKAEKRLWCTYKGYLVYSEISGDLEGYAPFEEWENMIDRLYKVAKDKKKKLELDMEPLVEQVAHRKKQAFWQKLRFKWGI
jgi:hypothetical protein